MDGQDSVPIFPLLPARGRLGESKEQGNPRDEETVGMVIIAPADEIPTSPNSTNSVKSFDFWGYTST